MGRARLQDTMNWHMQAAQQRGRDQIAMQQMLAGQMALNAQANHTNLLSNIEYSGR
jgi:hypothetical protein